jgi:hypothetical protein
LVLLRPLKSTVFIRLEGLLLRLGAKLGLGLRSALLFLKRLQTSLGAKLSLRLRSTLGVLKRLLSRLGSELRFGLLSPLGVFKGLLACLSAKLGLPLLPSLLFLKSLLRLLRSILKACLTHPRCCPTLFLQNIAGKLRSLDSLTGTAKSACLHRSGVLFIGGNITLPADIGQSLLYSLVFKRVLELRNGVGVKALRGVALRVAKLLRLITRRSTKLLRRVVLRVAKLLRRVVWTSTEALRLITRRSAKLLRRVVWASTEALRVVTGSSLEPSPGRTQLPFGRTQSPYTLVEYTKTRP